MSNSEEETKDKPSKKLLKDERKRLYILRLGYVFFSLCQNQRNLWPHETSNESRGANYAFLILRTKQFPAKTLEKSNLRERLCQINRFNGLRNYVEGFGGKEAFVNGSQINSRPWIFMHVEFWINIGWQWGFEGEPLQCYRQTNDHSW